MRSIKTATIRRLFDAVWRDRDLDAAWELVDPEAEFDWSDSRAPYRGHFKGRAALTEAFQAMIDAWDEWDPEFEEVIEVDDETGHVLDVRRVGLR